VSDQALSPGNDNVLCVHRSDVTAFSGAQQDVMLDASGPLGPLSPDLALQNRLYVDETCPPTPL